MRAVGIKELKNKLSEYLRLVQTGETVLVTDRNKVVAQLMGPPSGYMVSEGWLAKGVREGWATAPVVPYSEPMPTGLPVATLDEILRELDEDRSDR